MKSPHTLINNHLLASLALTYMLGLTLSAYYLLPAGILFTCAVTVALCLLCLYLRFNVNCTLPFALLLFLLTGLYQGTLSNRLPESQTHIYNLIQEPADVVLIGQLLSMPTYDGTTSQALITLKSVQRNNADPPIPASGKILLRMRGHWPVENSPGSMLAIRAMIKRPSHYRTPGTFDYPAYLARKDIWVTGFIRSSAQMHLLQNVVSVIDTIHYFPEQLRTEIGRFIDQNVPGQTSGIYRAILLGDRSRIPYQTLESFKASGTMHILAISGIHLTLIGVLLFTSIYWLLRRSETLTLRFNVKKIAGLLCLPLLASYALLAGMNSPVLRACVMSTTLILAFCTNRPKTLSSLIAFAALLILAHSPQALFTASFQLSFAAFSTIMLIAPVLQKHLSQKDLIQRKLALSILVKVKNWSIAAFIAASAAVLGTAPIVILYFHRFPLAGPVANLILEPLICLWALPLGFLALPFIFILPDLASLLFHIGGTGLSLALQVAQIFQSLPQTTLWLPPPGALLITCYYVTLTYTLLTCASCPPRLVLRATPFIICLCLLLTPQIRNSRSEVETPVMHVLDVGQGSATLLQLPGGNNVLLDGGGSSYSMESVGQRIIAPFLWSLGITQLDTIIITHPDADHYNGIPFLLEHFSPSLLWTSTITGGDHNYSKLIDFAERGKIQIRIPMAGDMLNAGDTSIRCLVNGDQYSENGTNRNAGLVIRVITGTHSYLFPGDIESNTEEKILQDNVPLASEILLAAHHGSATSNSIQFLQQVNPSLIIASAGQSRKNYFPSDQLRQYCLQHQLPLLVTADSGTLTIRNTGNQTEIYKRNMGDNNPLRRNRKNWITAHIIGNTLIDAEE